VLDQDAVLEDRDLGAVALLADDHRAVDGLAAGQELGLGQDRLAAAAGVAALLRRTRLAAMRVEPVMPRTPSSSALVAPDRLRVRGSRGSRTRRGHCRRSSRAARARRRRRRRVPLGLSSSSSLAVGRLGLAPRPAVSSSSVGGGLVVAARPRPRRPRRRRRGGRRPPVVSSRVVLRRLDRSLDRQARLDQLGHQRARREGAAGARRGGDGAARARPARRRPRRPPAPSRHGLGRLEGDRRGAAAAGVRLAGAGRRALRW
jgi:hypothetical protein